MLDSDIETLRARHQAAEAAAQAAFEKALSMIEDLETLAAAAPAPVRDLAPGPSGQQLGCWLPGSTPCKRLTAQRALIL